MGQHVSIDSSDCERAGYAEALHDRQWACEVERETVRMVSEREKHTLAANLIGWLGCCIAANFLPDPSIMGIPLLLRLVAIASTRIS